MKKLSCLLLLTVMLTASWAEAQVNQQGIDDVAAGRVKEAKASWWGFDATDATECLQAAINSGVNRLIVDNMGTPWYVEPLFLVSNQEIVFEEGVEVVAKRGSFKGGNDSLITARAVENITLRGNGATLRMWRDDYDNPELYTKAEWRHVIQLRGTTNIRIYDLVLAESGGDGIYLGIGPGGSTNKDTHIRGVVCDKNYRQGISIITADNLLIEDTIMSNTAGTAPAAGIDFEPNNPEELLVNVRMRNCLAINNAGDGYVAYLPPMRASSEPVSMIIENCRAVDNQGASLRIVTGNGPEAAVTGRIDIIDCEFEESKSGGFVVSNNPPTGLQMLLRNVTISNAAVDHPVQTPIMFTTRQEAIQDVGGVTFENVVVRDPVDRAPMSFVDMAAGLSVADVSGNIILEKDGERIDVALTEEILAEWMPVLDLPRIPRFDMAGVAFRPLISTTDPANYSLEFARLRKTANAAVFARANEEVVITILHGRIANYSSPDIPLVVTSSTGEEIARVVIPLLQERELRFTAPATDLYRLSATPGNFFRFMASSHPLNLITENGALNFYSQWPIGPDTGGGRYYFYVPENTDEFGVRVFGEGAGEAVKATLYNPAGEVVVEEDNVVSTRILTAPPTPGIWSVELALPTDLAMEDFFIDLLGIPSLLAPSPEAILVPAKLVPAKD